MNTKQIGNCWEKKVGFVKFGKKEKKNLLAAPLFLSKKSVEQDIKLVWP